MDLGGFVESLFYVLEEGAPPKVDDSSGYHVFLEVGVGMADVAGEEETEGWTDVGADPAPPLHFDLSLIHI